MHETAAGVTLEQAKLLRQALGLDDSHNGQAYRRHFRARVGDERFEAMVATGWMERGRKLAGRRDRYYFVTEAGAVAVGSTLPD